MAEHYFCGWGPVLESVLPRGAKSAKGSRWKLLVHPASCTDRACRAPAKASGRAFESFGSPWFTDGNEGTLGNCTLRPGSRSRLAALSWATIGARARVSHVMPLVPGLTSTRRAKLTAGAGERRVGVVVDALNTNRSSKFLLHGVTERKKRKSISITDRGAAQTGKAVDRSRSRNQPYSTETIQRFRERSNESPSCIAGSLTPDVGATGEKIATGDVDRS